MIVSKQIAICFFWKPMNSRITVSVDELGNPSHITEMDVKKKPDDHEFESISSAAVLSNHILQVCSRLGRAGETGLTTKLFHQLQAACIAIHRLKTT